MKIEFKQEYNEKDETPIEERCICIVDDFGITTETTLALQRQEIQSLDETIAVLEAKKVQQLTKIKIIEKSINS